MKYELLGEDQQPLSEKLAKYTGEVTWSYLKPHFQRGTLYFLDSSLSLEEAGEAFVKDDKEQVSEWVKQGRLVQIEDLHAKQWEVEEQNEGGEKSLFLALVVSPFVLMQPYKDPSNNKSKIG